MAVRLDVRRLAAIDMWGSAGARWRRWVILAEFLTGVAGCGALAVVLLGSGSTPSVVFGAWLAGVAANYVPLAVHALTLARPGALESEIAGVDVPAELRHYTGAQVWILVPLLVVWLAAVQWRR
jgi:hypothetical protein